jgi:hypothetical protein
MKAYFLIGALIASGAAHTSDMEAATLSGQLATNPANSDLDAIRQQIDLMRKEYEARLQDLENRLAQAEQQAAESEELREELEETVEELALAPAGSQVASRPSDFNPGIGVVMVGTAQRFEPSVGEFEIPGFALGEETGLGEEGLSIGESDFTLDGNIDDKFYGSMTLAVTKEEGVVLEEAYVQTLGLGGGFNLKAGRFFSSIGYMNEKHLHTDDFFGRPLPYRAMLGNQYGDDGLQLSWLAPTEIYWTVDLEVFRGDEFPAGGAAHRGFGTWALSSHWGGDFGDSHSWQAGLSLLSMDIEERSTGEDQDEFFTGDSELYIADLVYKWAPAGNARNQAVKLQGEYFWRQEDGLFTSVDGDELGYDGDQSGWYLEGVYQFRPRWRLGVRHSQVGADRLGAAFTDTSLDTERHTPRKNTLMLDWTNSEFSRIRLQYSRDESMRDAVDIWTVQYIMSLGAHAAHSY